MKIKMYYREVGRGAMCNKSIDRLIIKRNCIDIIDDILYTMQYAYMCKYHYDINTKFDIYINSPTRYKISGISPKRKPPN